MGSIGSLIEDAISINDEQMYEELDEEMGEDGIMVMEDREYDDGIFEEDDIFEEDEIFEDDDIFEDDEEEDREELSDPSIEDEADSEEDEAYSEEVDSEEDGILYDDGMEDVADSGIIDAITQLKDRYTNILSDKTLEIKSLTEDKIRLESEIVELEALVADLKGKYNELSSKNNELLNKCKNIVSNYAKLKSESDRLKRISRLAIEDTLDSKVSKGEKLAIGVQDEKSDNGVSKIEYYSSLSLDKLYTLVVDYLKKTGVQKSTVARSILNEEFGTSNINKLIVKSYLVPLGNTVTIGHVK